MHKLKIIIPILILIIIVASLSLTGRHTKIVKVVVKQKYIALGDSVAAGVGLTTGSDSSACDRTNESYPNLVAQKLNYDLTSIACTGTLTSSGIINSQTVNELSVAPQLSQLFSLNKPKLITITIGANDLGWTTYLSKCFTGICGTNSDSREVEAKIKNLGENINNILTMINTHYNTSPPIVVLTGYNQIFTKKQINCSDMTGIDLSEVNWVDSELNNLNNEISKSAANYNFTKYAGVDFNGHELCSTDPWVQSLSGKMPFHPTEAGQKIYDLAVLKSLNN